MTETIKLTGSISNGTLLRIWIRLQVFILIGTGLDLGPVNKHSLSGNPAKLLQCCDYLYHELFRTLGEMGRDETGDRGMVRKIHEIDIPAAGRLYIPAGIDTVHRCIENDLQKLPRCRLIFPDPLISTIEFRKILSLHECTQKADRVISRDLFLYA